MSISHFFVCFIFFICLSPVCVFRHVSYNVVSFLDNSDNFVVAQSNYLSGNIRYCSIYSLFVWKCQWSDTNSSYVFRQKSNIQQYSIDIFSCIHHVCQLRSVNYDQVESLDEQTKFIIILTLKIKHKTLPHNFVGVKNST